MLEPEARAGAVEPGLVLAHEVRAVGVRAEPEREHLRAHDHQQRAADQRVDAPRTAEQFEPAADDRGDERAEAGEQQPGDDEEVRRAVHQQEAQVPPAVAEARELRFAAARVVGDRDLGDLEVLLGGAHDHLRGELHPGRAEVEPLQRVAAQRAHAAVRVLDAGLEEEVEDAGEDRVADVAVKPRHGARLDVVHAVADRHVRALLEQRHEARDVAEVVGEVGVGHHDVAALGGGEAGEVGAPVATAALGDHARPGVLGEPRRVVLGAVVHHEHLAPLPHAVERLTRRVDARLDVLGLVQAGDHHRDPRSVGVGVLAGPLGRCAGGGAHRQLESLRVNAGVAGGGGACAAP